MTSRQPSSFLAIDWGTSNRRVYRIDDGQVGAFAADNGGAAKVSSFPTELEWIRRAHGDLPVLMAGMVGSTIGWRDARYVPAPAGLDDLASKLCRIDARTAIVPGVSVVRVGRGDVMRGEEVQALGALEAGSVPQDALVVLPGTHCKWAILQDGKIADFVTAMTGELFALMRNHSILAGQLTGEVRDGPAFIEGVRAGAKRDLVADLFQVRASNLLGTRDSADATSYVSGLIIGSDVAARMTQAKDQAAHVVIATPLDELYATAIEACGHQAIRVDGRTAFLGGMMALAGYL